ncbi:MAG: signal peptidase II [Dehalococcoidia bacterium]|nr:signal peptidase II [Dehalococcoidia bacterium]
MPAKLRIPPVFWIIAATSIILDRVTKLLVRANIPLGGSWPESGFFRITHGENTGAAFGILQDARVLLVTISCIGTASALYIALVLYKKWDFLRWKTSVAALGLILGGTIGNLIDRAATGRVTDFIHVGGFPDFNIADSSLVVGGIIMAVNLIRASYRLEVSDDKSVPPQS